MSADFKVPSWCERDLPKWGYLDNRGQLHGPLQGRDVAHAAYHEAAHVVLHLRARFPPARILKMWVATHIPTDRAGFVQIDGPDLYLPGALDGCSVEAEREDLERRRTAELQVKLAGVAPEDLLARRDPVSAARDLEAWAHLRGAEASDDGSDLSVASAIVYELGTGLDVVSSEALGSVQANWSSIAALADDPLAKRARPQRKTLTIKEMTAILFRVGSVR